MARPVAPVYLMPLVEIAGPAGAHATMEKAARILRSMGMLPVMRKLADGLVDPWPFLTASTTPAMGARQRDAILVAMLRALKRQGTAAGEAIRAQEMELPIRQEGNLMVTARRTIPPSWTDANGHMNEAHYVEVASNATDVLTESCGVTAEYIASGRSHFTVETHVRYLAELHEGEEITVRSQLLFAEGRKAHVFHYIHGPGGRLAATVEVLLLHVDLASRRVSAPSAPVAAALKTLELAHRGLPRPKDAGNAIRDPRGVAPAVRPEATQEIATC